MCSWVLSSLGIFRKPAQININYFKAKTRVDFEVSKCGKRETIAIYFRNIIIFIGLCKKSFYKFHFLTIINYGQIGNYIK